MATFFCSVLFPPVRFVSRERVEAHCMYDAFLKFSRKYKPINRHDPLYLVQYKNHRKYFDINGVEVK